MIVGILLVGLLLGRELLRAADPDSPGARLIGPMLAPVAVGFGLVVAVRLASLVIGRA